MMMGAQYVAQGVVEEKSSRVVEVLLSTVRPWQLMAGKVIGIGIFVLGLLFALLLAAFITVTATGLMGQIGAGLNFGSSLFWAAIWALIGFVTFAVIMAALASLVSRQEEVGSVTTPAILILAVPFVIGVNLLPNDPTNRIAEILSYIPLFSPTLMPLRYALGVASLPQMLLALAISLVALPVFLWLASKIYAGAVLRTGARVNLRDALGR
jgi:ABC-2 type transport system permease protein